MAKPWREVIESEAFRALPTEEQARAQEQYFAETVAAQVRPEEWNAAWDQFTKVYPLPTGESKRWFPPEEKSVPEVSLPKRMAHLPARFLAGLSSVPALAADVVGLPLSGLKGGFAREPFYLTKRVDEAYREPFREMEEASTFDRYMGRISEELGAAAPGVAGGMRVAQRALSPLSAVPEAVGGAGGVAKRGGELLEALSEMARDNPARFAAMEALAAGGGGLGGEVSQDLVGGDSAAADFVGTLIGSFGATSTVALLNRARKLAGVAATRAGRKALRAESPLYRPFHHAAADRLGNLAGIEEVEGVSTLTGEPRVARRVNPMDTPRVDEARALEANFPGVEYPTHELLQDDRLARLARGARARAESDVAAQLATREGENVAAVREGIMDPRGVGGDFRETTDWFQGQDRGRQIAAEQAQAGVESQLQSATARLENLVGALGVRLPPETSGRALREMLQAEDSRVYELVRQLYAQVDPDRATRIPLDDFYQQVLGIRGKIHESLRARHEPEAVSTALDIMSGRMKPEVPTEPGYSGGAREIDLDADGATAGNPAELSAAPNVPGTFDDLVSLDRAVNEEIRALERTNNPEYRTRLKFLKEMKGTLDELSARVQEDGTLSEDAIMKWKQAKESMRTYASGKGEGLGFRSGVAQDILRPSPGEEFRVPDVKVAAKIVAPGEQGAENVRQYLRAFGGNTGERGKAVATVIDHLKRDLADHVDYGGKLNGPTLKRWYRRYRDILDLPEMREAKKVFDDIAAVQGEVDKLHADLKAKNTLTPQEDIDRKVAELFLNDTVDNVVPSLFSGNSVQKMRTAVRLARKDRSGRALRGLRRGVWEHIEKSASDEFRKEVQAVSGEPFWYAKNLRKLLDNEDVLVGTGLFTKEEIGRWRKVQRHIEIVREGKAAKSILGSDTKSGLETANYVGRSLYWLTARNPAVMAVATIATGIDKVLGRMSRDQIARILDEALVDPRVADDLFRTWTTQNRKRMRRVLHGHLVNVLGRFEAGRIMEGDQPQN